MLTFFYYVYEPNIHLVILEAIKIVHSISENTKNDEFGAMSNILEGMKAKWCAYFGEFPYINGIVVILDPGLKLDGLRSLLNFYNEFLNLEVDVDS